jgi:hypothetical protein
VVEDFAAHSQRVSSVRSSSSGGYLASGDASGCVVVWGTGLPSAVTGRPASLPSASAGDEYDSVAE